MRYKFIVNLVFWQMGTISSIIAAQESQPNLVEARKILQQASETAQAVFYRKEVVLGDIARAQAAARDMTAALQTVNNLRGVDSKSHTLLELVNIQTRAKDFKGASATANLIERSVEKHSALSAIAARQAEDGDIDGALQTADGIGDSRTRSNILYAVAIAQLKAGDAQRALQAASGIQLAQVKAAGLIAIAEAQVAKGDKPGAVATLQDALKNVNAIDSSSVVGIHPQSRMLLEIATARATAGDGKGALALVDNIPNPNGKVAYLNAIAEGQTKAGDTAGAKLLHN